MLFSESPGSISSLPAFEVTAASSTVVREIYDVLSAVEPAPPELSQLAVRAMLNLNAALLEASGTPGDARWRTAYDALALFLERCRLHARGCAPCGAFARLSDFLGENSDLSPSYAHEAEPPYRALALR